MSDPIRETTDALLECVAKVAAITGQTYLPTSALLVYQGITEDGDQKVDYVVTESLGLTDLIGLAHFVREDAIDDLLAQKEDK